MHKRQSIARGRDTLIFAVSSPPSRSFVPRSRPVRRAAMRHISLLALSDARAHDVLVVIHRLHRRTADPQAKSECAEGLCPLVQYYDSFQLPTTNECFQKNQIACGRRVTLMRAYVHGDSADARPLVICT